jgi:hypothetical protein
MVYILLINCIAIRSQDISAGISTGYMLSNGGITVGIVVG